MGNKKNPKDYNYGKPCEDHLGNSFKTIQDMCDNYGISYSIYVRRKKNGWELERILTTPPMWGVYKGNKRSVRRSA